MIAFAKRHPEFEVVVQPKFGQHPHIRAYYSWFQVVVLDYFYTILFYCIIDNGHEKLVCVRNSPPTIIHEFVELYRDTSGVDPFKPKKPVISVEESVRGVWSPFKNVKLRPDRQPLAPKHLYSNDI